MRSGTLLGLFFFFGVIIFGVITVSVTEFSLAEKEEVVVEFDDVKGLQAGDEVRVFGVKVGNVDFIELSNGNVKVHLLMDSHIVLREDYSITVESFSILGGNYLVINPGKVGSPELGESASLSGSVRPGGLDQIGVLVEENRESIKAIMESIREVTDDLAAGRGSIGKALKDEKLYDELAETVENLRVTTEKIRNGEGSIGKAINDPKLYDDLADTIEDLKEVARRLEEGEGTIGKLMTEEEIYERIQEISANIEDISKRVLDTAEHIQEGKGMVGRMLYNEELGERLERTIENVEIISEDLKSLTGDLRNKESLLNIMITDEEVGRQAKEALDGIGETIGKAANYKVWFGGDYSIYTDQEHSVAKLWLKLEPNPDRFLRAGVALYGLDVDSEVDYDRKADDESDAEAFVDIQLGWRFREYFGEHIWVRGGLIEGRPGGAIDFEMNDTFGEDYDLLLTFEGRDAFNDLDRDNLDENIDGPMLRSYATFRAWDNLYVTGGANNIGDGTEFFFRIGWEYEDEDIKALVALLNLGS